MICIEMKLNIPVHYQIQSYLQFNIRYEKVERPAPVGGALVLPSGFEK